MNILLYVVFGFNIGMSLARKDYGEALAWFCAVMMLTRAVLVERKN